MVGGCHVIVCCSRGLLALALLFTLGACAQSDETASQTNEPAEQAAPAMAFTQPRSGEATFYRATGEGNCSFAAGADRQVAAISNQDYADAALCGAYLNVTGPQGSVTVRVTDRCPGCKPGSLDLSREAFEQIAAKSSGRMPVTWQVVAGPVSGPIRYHYKAGATRYWTAIQVRNHKWPVSKLAILPNGASRWLELERRAYNYFVHPETIAAGPLRVRVTAATGEVLEDILPEPTGNTLVQGSAQFD